MLMIPATLLIMLLTACTNSPGEYDGIYEDLIAEERTLSDSTFPVATRDFRFDLPVSWRQTIVTDSSVTVDNQVLDEVSGYQLITVMRHSAPANTSLTEVETAYATFLSRTPSIQPLVQGTFSWRGHPALIALAVDTEQVTLLDSNILVTYSLLHPAGQPKFLIVQTQSYGTNRFREQLDMRRIVNSIEWVE